MTIRAGVVGATGYVGAELCRLLARHPNASIAWATSESHAGSSLADVVPLAPDVPLVATGDAPLGEAAVVFLGLPPGASAPIAAAALEAGARVVDLGADFRLPDADCYAAWYGLEHPAPELLGSAVYGLTELVRTELDTPGTRLVANPGCYPTSVLLALHPLLGTDAIGGTVIVDAKSGVSGAGRAPRQDTHFVEVADNFAPYRIGRVHRHLPEMERWLGRWSDAPPPLVFSPHLLPVRRGILSTIYVPLAAGWDEGAVRALFASAYEGEPFVRVLPPNRLPSLADVQGTNCCLIGLTPAGDTLIVTSAIDNLVKGAAGQAVQNANRLFGLPETAGLV